MQEFWELLPSLELAAIAYDNFVVGSIVIVDGKRGETVEEGLA